MSQSDSVTLIFTNLADATEHPRHRSDAAGVQGVRVFS